MAVPVHGLPPLLREGLDVAVVPPPLKATRWHVVERSSNVGGAGQLVAFADVCALASADALVGKTLLARIDDLPRNLAMQDADALLGRAVEDVEHGALGTIVEVMRGVAQDVWVIEGPYGEVLLPAIDEFVLDLTEDDPIKVCIPAGTISRQGE